jgi:hypothetical protein
MLPTLRDIISKATAAGPGHIRVDSYLERLLSPVGKPYCEVWSVIVLSTVIASHAVTMLTTCRASTHGKRAVELKLLECYHYDAVQAQGTLCATSLAKPPQRVLAI